jgi:hypothetical protein
MVANKFKNRNLAQPMRSCRIHPRGLDFFCFWKRGMGGCEFFFFPILDLEGCRFFFFYFGSQVVFFVSWQTFLLCWFSLHGGCEGPEVVLFFTYICEPHGVNTKGKLLFWFSLQGGCEGPKVVLLFTYIGEPHGMNTKCKLLFWFSLQAGWRGAKIE